jgi:hypothetical protein
MKVVVVGDTHCNISHINFWVEFALQRGIDPACCLQPGDFGFYSPKQMGSRDTGWEPWRSGARKFLRPTIVVPGNHENGRVAIDAMNPGGPLGAIVKNFKCLTEGEMFVFTAPNGETLSIMGVGGAYCVDKPPPDERYAHDNRVFLTAIDQWQGAGHPWIDILMTHEAPVGVPLVKDPRIQEAFKLDPNRPLGDMRCRRLWEAVMPHLHISGHHHQLLFHEEQHGERVLKHLTADLSGRSAVLVDTKTWELTLLRPEAD